MERKIVKVEAYESSYGELDIELDNHNVILLTLMSKRSDPLFAEIIEERLTPYTDGECIYWRNGASLTLGQIITMLRDAESGDYAWP